MDIKNPIIHNIYPEDVWKWQEIEKRIRQVAELYNFKEVRMSLLQDQQVIENIINNSFGKDDDLDLSNFFYLINDEQGLALRPENTVSILEGKIGTLAKEQEQRVFYHGPVFRREMMIPLYQQVYEVGFEIIGNQSLIADVEIMKIAYNLCRKLGLPDPEIHLASYGCDKCRPRYIEALYDFLKSLDAERCVDCSGVIVFNPFKMTSCDRDHCSQVSESAPHIMDYLCDDCVDHLGNIERILQNLMMDFVIDKQVMRPFGYYNRTVFNVHVPLNDEEIVVGGGGRYDLLSQKIRNDSIPAVGFSFDQLKLIKIMEQYHRFSIGSNEFSTMVCALDDGLGLNLLQIEQELHEEDYHTVLVTDCTSLSCAQGKGDETELLACDRIDRIRFTTR